MEPDTTGGRLPAVRNGFEERASRALGALPHLARRVPFTLAFLTVAVLVGVISRTVWRPLSGASWLSDVAYGSPALREGRLWNFVTGWFFALTPAQFVNGVLVFALLVGFCELRLGTRRAAWVVVVGQFGGVLAAAALVQLLSATSWLWAQAVAEARDVGFTTGALAAAAVTSATLRSPWRLRMRAVLWLYVTVAFLFEGTLADVAHGVAVAGGLVLGQRLWAVEAGFGPRTRRETRMLAFVGLVALMVTQLLVLLFPGGGPFGVIHSTAVASLFVELIVVVMVANSLRHGKRWAWWVVVVLGVLKLTQAVLALVLILAGRLPQGAPIALGGGMLWLGELGFLLVYRRVFRVPLRRGVPGGVAADPDSGSRVRTLLAEVGGSTMSWMTTWPENSYVFTREGHGYVAYQQHAGVAIALTDPVVPVPVLADAIRDFTAATEQGGLVACLFSISGTTAAAARTAGWRTTQIAEDAIVDLPGLAFTGRRWQDIRTAANRAERAGIGFRLVRLADEPFAVLAQVRAISEQWVGEKGLPEMGFTLGGVDEAMDPDVLVGLAVDDAGNVHGVTSWLPVYTGGGRVTGWTLDVMRRRRDGFPPVMEFLIASASMALRAEGAEFVSLSGAPLAHTEPTALAGVERLLDLLGGALEPLYGFRSLHAFKAKFCPRYEPIHLAFRDEADLPRIGVALVRGYLPGATTRQIVAATRSTRAG